MSNKHHRRYKTCSTCSAPVPCAGETAGNPCYKYNPSDPLGAPDRWLHVSTCYQCGHRNTWNTWITGNSAPPLPPIVVRLGAQPAQMSLPIAAHVEDTPTAPIPKHKCEWRYPGEPCWGVVASVHAPDGSGRQLGRCCEGHWDLACHKSGWKGLANKVYIPKPRPDTEKNQ